MSEIMKEPVEQVKQAFRERISSPLWGYVFFSWLGFNWQNIAKLFMSKREVEVRIAEITSQEWFFVHYIALPVIVGASLAASSPYLQQWLSTAHKKAEEKMNADNLTEELRLLDVDMVKKRKSIELANVEELTNKSEQAKVDRQDERNKNRLEFQRLRGVKISKAIDDIEKSFNDANDKLQDKLNEIKVADETYKLKMQALENLAEGLSKVADLYHTYRDVNSREEFASFLSEIKKGDYFGSAQLDKKFEAMAQREILLEALSRTKNVNS
ncbi:hypothetical protein ACQPT2_01570 [Erwinia amylovora]